LKEEKFHATLQLKVLIRERREFKNLKASKLNIVAM
jgi:hypothetical protein